MDLYLKAIGWWNLIGSLLMFFLLSESIANKVLIEWSAIFTEKYTATFYVKFWLVFAIGLNIFYGLVNIMAGYWEYDNIRSCIIWVDVIAYIGVLSVAIWGLVAGKCGLGILVGFLIFSVWILWGIYVLKSAAGVKSRYLVKSDEYIIWC